MVIINFITFLSSQLRFVYTPLHYSKNHAKLVGFDEREKNILNQKNLS
jgi:hypothetical protein